MTARCDGISGTATVVVAGGQAPQSGTVATVEVAVANGALAPGQSTLASARLKDANGNNVVSTDTTWSSSNNAVVSVTDQGLITAIAGGVATITASVGSVTGGASVSVSTSGTGSPPPTSDPSGAQAVAPAVPQSTPSASVPDPTGRVIRVAGGGDLQGAISAALPGDAILLAPGATFYGNFELPVKACNGWITIRTDTPDANLPGSTQRITPSYAGQLAKIVTPNTAPALKTTNPTCQWRVLGVEITGTLPESGLQYGLVWLGDGGWVGGGETQTSLDKVPQQLVLDRVYLHGSATLNSMRCLALNSGSTAVVNSWLSECHARGVDSQAIVGTNGPGPYLIENNYLEGAGENVMFGGNDPGIPGLVPSDITIRRNHFYKPMSWKGGPWAIKNLFELKSAQRMLVEGNIFENNWPAGQEGAAIVIKSNANGCLCTFEGTRDLTFRSNIVRNAPIALALAAADDSYGWTGFVHTQRVRIENNLFTNIGNDGTRRSLLLFTQDLMDVELAHNTFVHAAGAQGLVLPMAYSFGAARRIVLRDNVFTATAGYAFHNSDNGSVHSAALTAFAGDLSWSFQRNVVGGMSPEFAPLNPSASWYPSTVDGIGLAGDYSLGAASPYKGRSLGGTDPGVDIGELTRRTSGAVVQ